MNLKFKTLSIAILASAFTGVYAQTHADNSSSDTSDQTKKNATSCSMQLMPTSRVKFR